MERKTMEKNRRNKMKFLYATLNSLVPACNKSNQDPKEAKSLLDQIDEAMKYIKYLEATVNEAKEKKKRLIVRKRSHCSAVNPSTSTLEPFKTPKIDVRIHGSDLEVTVVDGICNDQFTLSDIVRVLHEERAEIMNVSFSVVGNSVYHSIHAEVREGTQVAAVTERLEKLVNGPTPSDSHELRQNPHQRDFDISPNIWDFEWLHACSFDLDNQ